MFTVNAYGVRIKQCCASCAFKFLKDDGQDGFQRRCRKHHKNVKATNCCKEWKMEEKLRNLSPRPIEFYKSKFNGQ